MVIFKAFCLNIYTFLAVTRRLFTNAVSSAEFQWFRMRSYVNHDLWVGIWKENIAAYYSICIYQFSSVAPVTGYQWLLNWIELNYYYSLVIITLLCNILIWGIRSFLPEMRLILWLPIHEISMQMKNNFNIIIVFKLTLTEFFF
jgi:hypothetical protein